MKNQLRYYHRIGLFTVVLIAFMLTKTLEGASFTTSFLPEPDKLIKPFGETFQVTLPNGVLDDLDIPDNEYVARVQVSYEYHWSVQNGGSGDGLTATILSGTDGGADVISTPGEYSVTFTGKATYTIITMENGVEQEDGPHEVTLTASENGRLTMPFRLVPVASLSSEGVISMTDTPGDNETLVIPVGYNNGSVTIRATPAPSGEWPLGTPVWSGPGSVSSDLEDEYIVSTNYAGTFTVSASCGTTTKTIKIVVFGMEIYAETFTGVVNDGTLISLRECMEGRLVTYTAKLSGDVSSGISKTYTFYFKQANGNTWSATVVSSENTVNYVTQADLVVNSPTAASHKFTTPVYCSVAVSGRTAVSDTINIDVYELWIKHFKDNATGKAWKVCVGDDIAYEAIASNDCGAWNWDMEDGFPDKWNPTGGNSKSGTGMKIPYSDLSSASNSHFGEAYGEVNVSCYDGENNFYRRYSSNMRGDSHKASVFFRPELNIDGSSPTQSKPPCWYVFWKNGNVVDTMNSTQWKFVSDLYGESSGNIIYLGPKAWTVNDGPERRKNNRTLDWVEITGDGEYLDCVSETIIHERYHLYCKNSWGGLGIRTGHMDSDGLPDTEENSPTSYQGVTFLASFINNPDTYSYNYVTSNGDDYSDQEVRCRIVERNKHLTIDRSKDWAAHEKNPKWN